MALLSIPLVTVLEITTPRTNKTIWCRTVSPGQTFALGYRHSVELSMVWDFFLIDGDYRLMLYETHFDSSNAGLPSVISEGEKLILEPDRIRITNRKIVFFSLQLWVNKNSLNTMEINSIRLSLPDLAGDQLVQIRLAKQAVGGYLRRRLLSPGGFSS